MVTKAILESEVVPNTTSVLTDIIDNIGCATINTPVQKNIVDKDYTKMWKDLGEQCKEQCKLCCYDPVFNEELKLMMESLN